jgi:methyl-accepting chemotaxis protein
MQALFAPAVSIMNRMRYTQKFGLLGVLMMVAIAVLVANLYSALDSNIRASRSELVGIASIKPAQRLIQSMQQHRGMSQGAIAGNEAMKEKRAAKEKDVSEALKAVEVTLSAALSGNAAWKNIKAEWEQVKADGLSWTGTESFARHTVVITALTNFMVEISDATSTDGGSRYRLLLPDRHNHQQGADGA